MGNELGDKAQENQKEKILKGLFHLPDIKENPRNEQKNGSEFQKTLGSKSGGKSIITSAAPTANIHSSISSPPVPRANEKVFL